MDCENCRHLTVVGLHDTGPITEEVKRRTAGGGWGVGGRGVGWSCGGGREEGGALKEE